MSGHGIHLDPGGGVAAPSVSFTRTAGGGGAPPTAVRSTSDTSTAARIPRSASFGSPCASVRPTLGRCSGPSLATWATRAGVRYAGSEPTLRGDRKGRSVDPRRKQRRHRRHFCIFGGRHRFDVHCIDYISDITSVLLHDAPIEGQFTKTYFLKK